MKSKFNFRKVRTIKRMVVNHMIKNYPKEVKDLNKNESFIKDKMKIIVNLTCSELHLPLNPKMQNFSVDASYAYLKYKYNIT